MSAWAPGRQCSRSEQQQQQHRGLVITSWPLRWLYPKNLTEISDIRAARHLPRCTPEDQDRVVVCG
jgi:hypothetical protein